MKIFIAVPTTDYVDVEFVRSLTSLETVGECHVELMAGSLVFANRDKLSEMAVNAEYDFVLWLDSDMIFAPDILKRLIAADKDIVSALAFMRRPPYDPVIYKTLKYGAPGEAQVEIFNDYPKDSVFEIDACGFGGVLVKTSVIRDVIEKNKTAFMPIPGYGEDISFCIRARREGYKIFCDSAVKMGHVARTVVTENTYRMLQGAKK